MRLLWITACYPTDRRPAEGVFHETQASALTELGVNVTVVAPVPWVPRWLPGRAGTYRSYPLQYRRNGVAVLRPRFFAHPRHFLYGAPHWFMTAAIRRLRLAPFDLVHLHGAYPCGLTLAQAKARVLTLHGSDVHWYPHKSRTCRRRFVRAVTSASQVVAVSESLARETLGLTGRRPRVLPIGIELSRFRKQQASSGAVRLRLGIPADRFVCLFVGRLVAAKGLQELLSVCTSSPDLECLVAGDGPMRGECEATPNVRCVGAVRNEMLPEYLSAADVLVLPSYGEGLPTVVLEAGAAGVPVIGTDVGGTSELLRDGRGYLIQPRSQASLAEAIESARNDLGPFRERAGRLRAYVERTFDVRQNTMALLATYGEAVESA